MDFRVDLLLNVETILSSFLPSVQRVDQLTMRRTNGLDRLQIQLIYQLEENIEFFRNLHRSIVETIELDEIPSRLRVEQTANSLIRLSEDAELVERAEETIEKWIDKIRHLIRQNSFVRQISSNFGPTDEIRFWQKRVVQFQQLVNQLRSADHRALIFLLNIAASSKATVKKFDISPSQSDV